MFEITLGQAARVQPLFSASHLTFVDSFFGGHMGRAFADDPRAPSCAALLVGDFCLLGGSAAAPSARQLVEELLSPPGQDVWVVVPPDEPWQRLVQQVHQERARPVTRYATRRTGDFDVARLRRLAQSLASGYTLSPITAPLYGALVASPLRDLCRHFSGAEDFLRRGVGFCVLEEGRPCAGAASYSVYGHGIEIEVDTLESHRRQGLATAACARLVLECLNRGLCPNWDAASQESLQLAQKLGYTPGHAYHALLLQGRGGLQPLCHKSHSCVNIL